MTSYGHRTIGWSAWYGTTLLLVAGLAPLFQEQVVAQEAAGSSAVSAMYESGQRLFEQGHYEQAAREFERVLAAEPHHAGAAQYLYLIDRRRQQAMVAAIRELQLKPHRDTLLGLASAPPPQTALSSNQPADTSATPGDWHLIVDDHEVPLHRPMLLSEGRPLVPLRDVAAALYISVIDLQDGTYELLLPQGQTKRIRPAVQMPEPVLTEQELRDEFGVETLFHPAERTLVLRTMEPPLHTAIVEKPAEQIQEETALKQLAQQFVPVPERPEVIPFSARRSVDLLGNVTTTYTATHQGEPFRSLGTSVTGQAMDFDVRFESVYKDKGFSGAKDILDHDHTSLSLTKPRFGIGLFDQYTSLAPLRTQSQTFNGIKVSESLDDWHRTTVAGGDVESSTSGRSGVVKYLGHLYEVDERLQPTDWLGLQGALLYLEHEADLPEHIGTTGYPRSNVVSFGGATVTLPCDVSWTAHAAHVAYRPDDAPESRVQDWDWRTRIGWDHQRYRLGWSYEFVGDRYATLGNPAVYQDYRGWNVDSGLRLTDRWTVSGNLQRYRNNVDDDPSDITLENQALSVSSNYQVTTNQTLGLSFNHFIANPSSEQQDPGSSTRSQIYRADYFFPFLFRTRLLSSYEYFRIAGPLSRDSSSHTVGTSFFRPYGHGSSWYLNPRLVQRSFEDGEERLALTTTLNLIHQLRRSVGVYLNSTYTREHPNTGAETTNLLAGSTGLRWQLLPQTAVNVEYAVNRYDLDTERWAWPRSWSILTFLSQTIGFSSAPSFGAIEGRVFQDQNANGVHDPDDPWVEDAVIRLEDRRQATTDPQGGFLLSYVAPGTQTVTLDLSSLDPDWTLAQSKQDVVVKRRRTAIVAFPLIQSASVAGRIFIDQNHDGLFQDTEEPLEGVGVLLLPGEQFRQTNADGVFRFDYLLPGSYAAQVVVDELPAGYALTTPPVISLDVKPGEHVQDIPFAVELLGSVKQF